MRVVFLPNCRTLMLPCANQPSAFRTWGSTWGTEGWLEPRPTNAGRGSHTAHVAGCRCVGSVPTPLEEIAPRKRGLADEDRDQSRRRRQYFLTAALSSTYVDGMARASELGEQATSTDPGVGLRAAADLRHLADQLEFAQVKRARELGWSWREIANRLDLTKQAVHQRYGPLLEEGP